MVLRTLGIAAVLISMAQIIPQLPGQDTGRPSKSSDQTKKDGEGGKKTAAQSVAVQKSDSATDSAGKGKQEAPNNTEYSVKLTRLPPVAIADKDKTVWDHIFDWGPWVFSLLLVAVGIIGVVLAHRTLRTFDRQAEIMHAQAELMKANMTQWVSFTNWRSTLVQRTGPVSPRPKTLRVDFDIVNPTSYPLKLRGVFRLNGTLPGHPDILIPDVTIQPNHPFTSGADVLMADYQADDYVGEGARISLHGEYFHIGPSKERSPTMEIHANIVCRAGQPTVSEYKTVNEKQGGGQESQNA